MRPPAAAGVALLLRRRSRRAAVEEETAIPLLSIAALFYMKNMLAAIEKLLAAIEKLSIFLLRRSSIAALRLTFCIVNFCSKTARPQ